VNARAKGHSTAEVGGDTFIENLSKGHGGMCHHTISSTTFRKTIMFFTHVDFFHFFRHINGLYSRNLI